MALSMRRIFSVIAVVALMAALMVASAMPAFAVANEESAAPRGTLSSTTTCYWGQLHADFFNISPNPKQTNKHYIRGQECLRK
jgi:hypothetical protein